jgi:hypothetical protein
LEKDVGSALETVSAACIHRRYKDNGGESAGNVGTLSHQRGERISMKKSSFWWTDEQLEALDRTFPAGSKDEVAKATGRSWGACRQKAKDMGIKRVVGKRKDWEGTALIFLRRVYSSETKEFIMAGLPGRAWQEIRRMARELGLLRDDGLIQAMRSRSAKRAAASQKKKKKEGISPSIKFHHLNLILSHFGQHVAAQNCQALREVSPQRTRLVLLRSIQKPARRGRPESERKYYQCYDRWIALAVKLGYESVDDALKDLYKSHPTMEVAKMLGVSKVTVLKQLTRLKVDMRPKGGANNTKGREPRYWVGKIPLKAWCEEHGRSYASISQSIRNGKKFDFITIK